MPGTGLLCEQVLAPDGTWPCDHMIRWWTVNIACFSVWALRMGCQEHENIAEFLGSLPFPSLTPNFCLLTEQENSPWTALLKQANKSLLFNSCVKRLWLSLPGESEPMKVEKKSSKSPREGSVGVQGCVLLRFKWDSCWEVTFKKEKTLECAWNLKILSHKCLLFKL